MGKGRSPLDTNFAAGTIAGVSRAEHSLRGRLRPLGPGVSLLVCLASAALAGEADVLAAEAACDAKRVCRFSVTVRHADAGWEHYADRWQVLTESGEVLATRVLRHPHVEEQPFTRQLRGVKIPEKVQRVRIRAHDSAHEDGGAEVVVELPGPGDAAAK
jgi:hypothetical protein